MPQTIEEAIEYAKKGEFTAISTKYVDGLNLDKEFMLALMGEDPEVQEAFIDFLSES